MVEETEDKEGLSGYGLRMCCPRCKSTDVVFGESKEGFFWISLCNNCGYRGKEGDKVGCIQ